MKTFILIFCAISLVGCTNKAQLYDRRDYKHEAIDFELKQSQECLRLQSLHEPFIPVNPNASYKVNPR